MKLNALILLLSISVCQEIYTEYLVENGDTTDVFSYQIPSNYNNDNIHPLLVTFHHWGGNQNSNYSTLYDEEANDRNWIMLSPYGGSSNNYNHQGMQNMVEKEIEWMMENFNINEQKIYMLGGSMGGASGAIYANNHLDPTKPMVAATASASGILDCERRAIEMDGNNSMIEWFGGNWDEVPFEYHRNSAVYFADTTQSMHYNLLHTPLYLDFGSTEPHRTHAEDLYNLLLHYNENMWIDNDPTPGHGYSVIDEEHSCEWLSQFELIDNPDIINVNLDEPSRTYWLEAKNINIEDEFIRIECEYCNENTYCINQFSNSDTLLFHILNDIIPSNIQFYNNQIDSIFTIGITGTSSMITLISDISFEEFGNSYWDNLNLEDEIIFVDISTGIYSMSFTFEEIEDINLDGIWNVLDIILLINHILGENLLYEFQLENADVNEDGIINILDIVFVINIILQD